MKDYFEIKDFESNIRNLQYDIDAAYKKFGECINILKTAERQDWNSSAFLKSIESAYTAALDASVFVNNIYDGAREVRLCKDVTNRDVLTASKKLSQSSGTLMNDGKSLYGLLEAVKDTGSVVLDNPIDLNKTVTQNEEKYFELRKKFVAEVKNYKQTLTGNGLNKVKEIIESQFEGVSTDLIKLLDLLQAFGYVENIFPETQGPNS